MALLLLAGGAAGYGYSAQQTPIYASHITFYVGSPALSSQNANSTNQFAQDRAASYASLLSSDRLAQSVIDASGLSIKPHQLAKKISASAQLNTVLIDATVRDPSQARATRIAGYVGQAFPKLVNELDDTGQGGSTVKLSVVSGPTNSGAPVSPRMRLNILLGVGVGFVLGLAVAVLREVVDVAVRSPADVCELTDYPVLGEIGLDAAAKKTPLIVDEPTAQQRSENFRQLRTNLQFLDAAEPIRAVVVTSSVAGEGKSTTAANLGIVFAESGQRVALVETDLRRPKLSDYLGLERASGLTSVLTGAASLDDVLQSWGANGLQVLASGPLPPNPSELLGGSRMRQVLDELRSRFDVVIMDAPPLLPVTDAALLSTHGAGVVVLARHGKVKRPQLRASLQSLETVNARVLGVVLTMRPTRGLDAAYRSDYYRSAQGADMPGGTGVLAAARAKYGLRTRNLWARVPRRRPRAAPRRPSPGPSAPEDNIDDHLRESLEPVRDSGDTP